MTEPQRSCLDVTEYHFRLLAQPPHSITIEGQSISHELPPGPLTLDELRVLMLKRRVGHRIKTAVWSYLVRMSHARPDPWIMIAAGMMLPGLKSIAARMNCCYPNDARDLDSEILEGFLQTLRLVDPDEPALHTQLYLAALRRGQQACRQENRQASRRAPLPENLLDTVAGNPDVALARAVREGAVTSTQADLISGVHLDCASRVQVAHQLRISRDQVRRELAAATRGLTAYLAGA